MDDAGHRRSHSHGQREEGQEGPDGLARPAGPAEVEGDGPDQGDEAAVEDSHDAADGEEDLELVVARLAGSRQQHRAHTQAEEGQL